MIELDNTYEHLHRGMHYSVSSDYRIMKVVRDDEIKGVIVCVYIYECRCEI